MLLHRWPSGNSRSLLTLLANSLHWNDLVLRSDGPWTDCNQSCNGGTKRAPAKCVDLYTREALSLSKCNVAADHEIEKACNVQPCACMIDLHSHVLLNQTFFCSLGCLAAMGGLLCFLWINWNQEEKQELSGWQLQRDWSEVLCCKCHCQWAWGNCQLRLTCMPK